MKKICACSLAALMLLAGCKEKAAPAGELQTEPQEASAPAPEPQPLLINSVMIAGGYWRLVSDWADEGKMKWVEYAVPGTPVQAYAAPGSSDAEPEPELMKQVVRTTDNQKRDFVHILFDGHDYWAQDYSIAVDAVPGVVLGNSAYIFSKPSPDAMGDRKLDIGTIVGVLNAPAASDSNPYAANYVRVNAYVQSRLLDGVYLSKDAVSILARDMLIMQIYEKLSAKDAQGGLTLTDAVARAELFETAYSLAMPDAVQDLFNTLYDAENPAAGGYGE